MNLEGAIGEIDLIQRLVELGSEKFTGAIRFEQEGIIKIVYFKAGDVLSASTNDRSDAVDEILLRAGKVSKEHVKQALSSRKENETLGDALLNLGFITRKELTWGRRIQVIGILRSVRGWATGTYAIVADYLPKREEGTLFPLPQILIELFVTEHERQPFERALDGGSAVLAKSASFDAEFQRLGLNEEAATIASKIDGTRSASEIASLAGRDVFNTYKLLEGLRALGLLEKVQAKDELGFESVGVADAADAWDSASAGMPAFQTEPEPPVEPALEAAPVAAAAIPPTDDMKWGFDEAQVEVAERAAEPPPSPPPPPAAAPKRPTLSGTQTQTRRIPPKFAKGQPKKASRVPVFGLIVILLAAAAGFAGWYWWKNRKPAPQQPVPVAQTTTHRIVVPAPAPPPPPSTTSAAVATPPPPASPPAQKTAPVPRPVPAAAARSTDKYAAMAAEYARNPKGNFTLQFELVCQSVSLAKAVEEGGSNVWFIPISYRGQQCYRVFWGRYDTRDAAEAAAPQIPASLHGGKAVVVAVPRP